MCSENELRYKVITPTGFIAVVDRHLSKRVNKCPYAKSTEDSRCFDDTDIVAYWENEGRPVKEWQSHKANTLCKNLNCAHEALLAADNLSIATHGIAEISVRQISAAAHDAFTASSRYDAIRLKWKRDIEGTKKK